MNRRQVLLIDDERVPTKLADDIDLMIVRTSAQAWEVLETEKTFSEIWFDHDLGKKPDGTIDQADKLMDYICERAANGTPPTEVVYVHSLNPAVMDIVRTLKKYYPVCRVLPKDLHLIKPEIEPVIADLREAVQRAVLRASALELIATRYLTAAIDHEKSADGSPKTAAIAAEAWAIHEKVSTMATTLRATHVDLELHGRLLGGQDDLQADKDTLQIIGERLHDDLANLDQDIQELATYSVAARQLKEQLQSASVQMQNSLDLVGNEVDNLHKLEQELGHSSPSMHADHSMEAPADASIDL